jgi:hypothetical protein
MPKRKSRKEEVPSDEIPMSEEGSPSEETAQYEEHSEEGESVESSSEESGRGHGIPKESQAHLYKAFSEFAIAMDTMFSRSSMIPEEAKEHGKAAKKEVLLMMKAILDAKIQCMDKKSSGKDEPKLKKIRVE